MFENIWKLIHKQSVTGHKDLIVKPFFNFISLFGPSQPRGQKLQCRSWDGQEFLKADHILCFTHFLCIDHITNNSQKYSLMGQITFSTRSLWKQKTCTKFSPLKQKIMRQIQPLKQNKKHAPNSAVSPQWQNLHLPHLSGFREGGPYASSSMWHVMWVEHQPTCQTSFH